MTFAFVAIAAVMVLFAVTLVIVPLIRHGRRNGRPRSAFVIALAAALIIPLGAIGLYTHVGNLGGLNPMLRQPPQITVDQAIAKIRTRLAKHPDDLRGWMLLGQSYSMMKQPSDALEAYGHALKLAPHNPDVMVAWAQADSMARSDHMITGKARRLLQKAVSKEPRAQRALWLLGISDYQAGHFADAALTWRRLRSLLQPGTKVSAAVDQQIAMANARARGKTQAEAEAIVNRGKSGPDQGGSATPHGAQLAVNVHVAPTLEGKVEDGDTLFVYARKPQGPPMPLAVIRKKAGTLPTHVTLTDGMGMAPGMTLSSSPRVIVTARISHSGQAVPQKGDLEGSSGPVKVGRGKPVDITIDHIR